LIVPHNTIGAAASSIAITPDSRLALVTNMKDNTVTVIDIAARKAASQTIPVGQNPIGIAISPDGKMALVANLHGSMTVLA
jgi:YVTN family beta-propeller protein